jgi:hypothetical protein
MAAVCTPDCREDGERCELDDFQVRSSKVREVEGSAAH